MTLKKKASNMKVIFCWFLHRAYRVMFKRVCYVSLLELLPTHGYINIINLLKYHDLPGWLFFLFFFLEFILKSYIMFFICRTLDLNLVLQKSPFLIQEMVSCVGQLIAMARAGRSK